MLGQEQQGTEARFGLREPPAMELHDPIALEILALILVQPLADGWVSQGPCAVGGLWQRSQ